MSKRKRNVPAHVGSRSQQQNQPPSHKYGAHPQLVAPDAKSFGKQLRPRSQENVQSYKLDDSTEGPVRSRQPNVAIALGLLGGAWLTRRHKFREHVWCQSVAVLLNLVLVAVVMVPSFREQVSPKIPAKLGKSYA